MGPGIVTVDLHGRNTYQAKIMIDAALRRSAGVYRLHLSTVFMAARHCGISSVKNTADTPR